MEMSQIRMYELLKNKIGDKETEAFVHIIEEKMDAKIDQRVQVLATKYDISELRIATRDDISALCLATKEEISALRLGTKEDMLTLRAELLRAIYLTSISQLIPIVASVISLVLLILKK
jgi:hypothetical protein